MAEVYGVEKLKTVVVSLAQVLNAVSKFINKQGLFALYGVVEPVKTLVALDWVQAKKELSEVSYDERLALEQAFKTEVNLQNPEAQKKLQDAVDCLEQVFAVAHEGFTVVENAKVVYEKLKQLVGA